MIYNGYCKNLHKNPLLKTLGIKNKNIYTDVKFDRAYL